MRQLASVQKIINLQPIEGKDKIELATVLGWLVVVQKGEFKIGDLCIYVEPDTLLPEKPEYEFLRKRCYSKKFGGFRIKVMKLGSVYSQGIVFSYTGKGKEGDDVSEEFGIKAYDLDELSEKRKPVIKYNWFKRFLIRIGLLKFNRKTQSFPSFAIKSDETRLQAIPEILNHIFPVIEGRPIYVTEKIDGCSAFYFYYKGKTGVCSRNVWLIKNKKGGYDNGQYFEMEEKYDILNKLTKYCKDNKVNIGVQGEIIGPSIQGNKYKLTERELYIYQIQDLDKNCFLDHIETVNICDYLGLKHVPIIGLDNFPKTVEDWVKASIGESVINSFVQREGIVVRSYKEHIIPNIKTVRQRLSFKVINPEFLLKDED
jgi:hypothetical protein